MAMGREPYHEDDAVNPQGVYAMSKLLGEWFARSAHHYVLRLESLFGGGTAPTRTEVTADLAAPSTEMADALLSGREVRAFVDRVVCRRATSTTSLRATRLLLADPNRRTRSFTIASPPGHATWLEVATVLGRSGSAWSPPFRGITLDELKLRAPPPPVLRPFEPQARRSRSGNAPLSAMP